MINKDRQRTFFTSLWDRGYNSGSGKTAGLHFFWLSLVKMPKVLHRYPSQNEFLLSQDAPCPKQAIPQNKLTLYRLSKYPKPKLPPNPGRLAPEPVRYFPENFGTGFSSNRHKNKLKNFSASGKPFQCLGGCFPPIPSSSNQTSPSPTCHHVKPCLG